MRYPALPPLVALVAGLLVALALPAPRTWLSLAPLLLLYLLAVRAFVLRRRGFLFSVLGAFTSAAWVLGSLANADARGAPLLDRYVRLAADGPPQVIAGVLRQDASPAPAGGVTLSLAATSFDFPAGADPHPAGVVGRAPGRPAPGMLGGLVVSVTGAMALDRLGDWRAGRVVRAPMSLREPTIYRNPGLRDERAALARRGIHLFGSIKSAALVEVVRPGGWWAERAADARAFTRRAVGRAVGRWSARSAAIVVAILIGDRAGLTSDVERRLQEAGTYHVIAISGGNIAILAGFLLGGCRLLSVRPRIAAVLTGVVLVAYADVAGGGASVNRATFMALIFLAALAADVRGATINALLAAAAVLLCATPLSLYDVAFAMTCGATLGILVAGARLARRLPSAGWLSAPASLLVASIAAELALLPVGAWAFSRITFAGLLLNFLAIPLMAVAQLAGMAVLPLALAWQPLADGAGLIAHLGAAGLVSSAGFVDLVPALTWRVPAPPAAAIGAYYAAWLLLLLNPSRLAPSVFRRELGTVFRLPPPALPRALRIASRCVLRAASRLAPAAWRVELRIVFRRVLRTSFRLAPGASRLERVARIRFGAVVALALSTTSILWSPIARWRGSRPTGLLRLTVLDVGQADSMLVRFPDGRAWLVDAGGSRAGGSFDVGGRVIEPVLWHHDVFRLDRFVVTHGDPDHVGGATALLHDFRVRELWEGIDVPRDAALQALRAQGMRGGVKSRFVRSGERMEVAGVTASVWHPPAPDWERQKVRNDDSVVLELRFGQVAFLLTGDIGKDVERELAGQFVPSGVRVLKVPHHGSAASSSAPFLEAARPAIAFLTVGASRVPRPSLETVIARYAAVGATLLRTDTEGAIELETDGSEVRVGTFAGRRIVLRR